ncbi:MAG TPA: imidazole glycerol phosphate synthase subunit HisH, partial [Gammaproteobacteria bacterium]|nr:imidazole glycerol phosphate synthase subunit HisH [Gammaproteobacteria bacterium]
EDPERIRSATHVILPGVGAARSAMERLSAAGLASVVPQLEQPVLGICVGMQVLMTSSEEEDADCLDIIPGRLSRFPQSAGLPVPHMGWSQIEVTEQSALLDGISDGAYAYFVHSYAAPVGPYTRSASRYGVEFSAVVEQDNFFGTQFHPERSSELGARILKNFLDL